MKNIYSDNPFDTYVSLGYNHEVSFRIKDLLIFYLIMYDGSLCQRPVKSV